MTGTVQLAFTFPVRLVLAIRPHSIRRVVRARHENFVSA
jgi:hypothetical protein